MKLSETNYELFAAKNYDAKRSSSFTEFQDDLKKVTYIKKLLIRYDENDDLQLRLLMNHIIVFMNCFGLAGAHMLFMRLPNHHNILRPILEFIGYMPDRVEFENIVINRLDITPDQNIVKELRKI